MIVCSQRANFSVPLCSGVESHGALCFFFLGGGAFDLNVTRKWPIRHTSGISGGFRQLRIYDSAVMANFGTFVMRPKEDTARDKLIPRKLVRQSRGDTKDEDVICYHSAHCRQILSIKTPLSSPSNSRIIWHVVHTRIVYVCVTSDRTIFQYGDLTFTAETWCRSVEGGPSGKWPWLHGVTSIPRDLGYCEALFTRTATEACVQSQHGRSVPAPIRGGARNSWRGAGAGSSQRQVRRNFQTDKQKNGLLI